MYQELKKRQLKSFVHICKLLTQNAKYDILSRGFAKIANPLEYVFTGVNMKKMYFLSLMALIICLFCGCASAPAQDSVCTVIVDCGNAFSAELQNTEKLEILPEDGIIYKTETACFSTGESVFDILKRELTTNKIHFEFNQTPTYFQAIGNIYEKDFGDMSGWVYTVNGESPTVGCDSYFPESGDAICFEYITSWE